MMLLPILIFSTFFRLNSLILSLSYLNDFAFLPFGLLWLVNLILAIVIPEAKGYLQVNLRNLYSFETNSI
jgi:hypothetical protein